MRPPLKNAEYFPLLGALKQIQFWLESTRPPQVMLAAQALEVFKRQKLPSHCSVRRRKIRGVRVPVRGRQQFSRFPNALAHWPEDGLVEGLTPTLAFVINGQADIRVADYTVHCETGDIIYIPDRIPKLDGSRPHYEHITPEAHCDLLMIRPYARSIMGVSIHLCHSQGEKHSASAAGEGCVIKHLLLPPLIAGLGDELQKQGNTKSTFYLLTSLILLLQQEIEQGRGFSSLQFPSESPLSYQQDPVLHAVEYMQNHLNRPLSIDQMAHWVGLSRTVFIKLFRQQTGASFKTHLTALRLEQAASYLLHSDLPVERISAMVGLTACQLRNLFRQQYQCSPREFRRSNKND